MKRLAFHTDQLSDQCRDYLGHSQPWPFSSPISSCHLVPQFLQYCTSWWPQSQPGYAARCVSLTVSLFPSEFKRQGLSWPGSANLLLWEGRELQSHSHWPDCSPELPWQLWCPGHGPGTFLWAYKVSLPSVFKGPVQPLTFKLLISWNSVDCSLCSYEDHLGVPVGCTSKWVQLPPTSLPTSLPSYFFSNSVSEDCMFLEINPFWQGCPIFGI